MGRKLMMVPGLLCTDQLFAHQLEHLHHLGAATADTRSDSTIADMAARLLAEAPERFDLCGLSMGGYVAFAVLTMAPERVERLVLIDTTARPDRAEQTAARRELVALARAEGMEPVMDRLLPNLVAPERLADAALTASIRSMAQEVGVETFARQQEAIIARKDVRPLLASFSVPTLVIVGAEDRLTPPELAREIASGIPDATLAEISQCGHMSTMEQPTRVNALIANFLER